LATLIARCRSGRSRGGEQRPGGVYVAVAIAWLWFVDGAQLTAGYLIGAGVAVAGMTIIMLPPRPS